MDCPKDVLDFCPGVLHGNSAVVFMALVNALFSAKCKLDPKKYFEEDYKLELQEGNEFDFVVVGGGTSGCVLANRLSENPNWKVLLLEAGGHPNVETEIPLFYNNLLRTKVDWDFETDHTDGVCSGFRDGICRWPKGKVLGGSSSINDMIHVEGSQLDWDQLGVKGWEWDSVSDYYEKARHALDFDAHASDDYKIREVLQEAAKEVGIDVNEARVMVKGAKRWSSAKAYLSPVKYRDNLFVATKAFVTRVTLNNKRATGVTVGWDEEFLNISASKEVVLAAGPINSPKILMLSGIGPPDHLEKFGIPCEVEAAVGSNLHDQLGVFGVFASLDESIADDVKFTLDDTYEYFMSKTGRLSKIGLANLIWDFSTVGASVPNVRVQHYLYPRNDGHQLRTNLHALAWNKDTAVSITNANKRHAILHLVITLLKPESVGKIRLSSNNPYKDPIVHTRYFSHENDLRTLMDALKEVKRYVASDPLAAYNATLMNFDLHKCNEFQFDTKEYWMCNFRSLVTTTRTQVGTCSMGAGDHHETVVDTKLNVKEVSGLRVVDPSVLPHAGTGNYQADALMIGEKGADIIKHEWKFTV